MRPTSPFDPAPPSEDSQVNDLRPIDASQRLGSRIKISSNSRAKEFAGGQVHSARLFSVPKNTYSDEQ